MTQDLTGKTFLITGATDGIGRAATTAFAQSRATITILGRNKAKTEQVIAELKAATGNQHIEYVLCDLSRLADVRRAAEEFRARHDRLDVLVNNAGATFKTTSLSPDGFELTFALNHLAHFQLTTSLLDLIRATEGARVISTSSGTQALGRLDVEKTPFATDVPGWRAYATSKLAAILFTKELQNHLSGSTAIANCFEPGSVRTQFGGFGSDQGFLLNIVYLLAKPFSRTPEQGADSLVWLASAPEAAALRGEYISNRRVATPSKSALDPDLARALWVRSAELCGQAAARAA